MSRAMLGLRPYQREAVDALDKAWGGGMKRPAVVMPTGSGKTVTFAHAIKEYCDRTGQRAMVLVHRDELADQTLDKLRSVAPHLHAGKVKASHNDVSAPLVVASVQTVSRRNRLDQLLTGSSRPIGLVVSDECHFALSPSWSRVLDAFPDAVHAGFTATLARGDGRGLGSVWEDVVFSRSLSWAIKNNFLVPPRGISVKVEGLDLSSVRKSGGDYQDGALGDALEDSHAMEAMARSYKQHASDRAGVVFTPTVATAVMGAEHLNSLGIKTAVITGETPRTERLSVYRDYESGRIQVLSNCAVLTTGFDAPHLSCVVMARPTRSNTLFSQCVGRGLRLFPGKSDCLVLDLAGASSDNKLQTLIDLEDGLYEESSPCEECLRLPCACPCASCGGPRPCRSCYGSSGVQFTGTGGSVDLFSASDSAWLRTPAGVWFIPCGAEGEVFLWEGPDATWDVCRSPAGPGKWQKLKTGLPLGMAMSWAEGEAEDLGTSIASRKARWRKGKPSEAQVNMARGMRISADGLTKGELSDRISGVRASQKFDRHVRKNG